LPSLPQGAPGAIYKRKHHAEDEDQERRGEAFQEARKRQIQAQQREPAPHPHEESPEAQASSARHDQRSSFRPARPAGDAAVLEEPRHATSQTRGYRPRRAQESPEGGKGFPRTP